MVATRYCPSCGLDRRAGDRFCRNCGAVLGTGQTSLSATPTAGSAPAPVAGPGAAATTPLQPVAPSPVLPAPPSAPQPPPQQAQQPAPTPAQAPRPLPFKPLALVGGVALVVGSILPWFSLGASVNALDIPIEFLWDVESQGDGPIKIGLVLIALGALGAGLAFVQRTAWVRRLCGSGSVAIVLAFAVQVFRAIDAGGGSPGDVFSAIGAGVYVAVVGALALQFSR